MGVYKITITQGRDGFYHAKLKARNGNVLFITPQAEQYTEKKLWRLCKKNFPLAKIKAG